MVLSFAVFQEPRGVMRILQFIFSICAFATISGYSGSTTLDCGNDEKLSFEFGYPFQLMYNKSLEIASQDNCNATLTIMEDFSSDAKFFVTTGVLAMLYTIVITVVYTNFEHLYKSNTNVPLTDFIITVIFGVLWLSSSAAWANGLTGIKYVTDISRLPMLCKCGTAVSSFSSLNISVMFGFLNFFLWASDLWFLYKETAWFQGTQLQTTSGV